MLLLNVKWKYTYNVCLAFLFPCLGLHAENWVCSWALCLEQTNQFNQKQSPNTVLRPVHTRDVCNRWYGGDSTMQDSVCCTLLLNARVYTLTLPDAPLDNIPGHAEFTVNFLILNHHFNGLLQSSYYVRYFEGNKNTQKCSQIIPVCIRRDTLTEHPLKFGCRAGKCSICVW